MSIIYSVCEGVSAASDIRILVSIDDQIQDTKRSHIGVAVRLDQTFGSYEELHLNKQSFHRAGSSLILNGRELKDDEQRPS